MISLYLHEHVNQEVNVDGYKEESSWLPAELLMIVCLVTYFALYIIPPECFSNCLLAYIYIYKAVCYSFHIPLKHIIFS